MPTLLTTFEVKEIAFAWGGTTRVFFNNELSVLGDEDLDTWTLSSKKRGYNFEGVWLGFDLISPYLQRKSPEPAAGNDWIDVKNAILKTDIDVTFYPIYSLDPAVGYVVSPVKGGSVKVLTVKRAMAYPEANLKFETQDQLDEYPGWLRNTRYKP